MNLAIYQLVMLSCPERTRLASRARDVLRQTFSTVSEWMPAGPAAPLPHERVGGGLTPAQRGCRIGHELIADRFLGSDADVALVLEDDVNIADPARLHAIASEFDRIHGKQDSGPALAQLEHRDRPWENPRLSITRSRTPGLVRIERPRWGTVAYLMNRPTAANYLVNQGKGSYTLPIGPMPVADVWQPKPDDCYMADPAHPIITTDHVESTIKSGRWQDVKITPVEES